MSRVELLLGPPHMQGLHDHVAGHPSPRALCWVEGACLLPPLTEEHWTPMGTPQPVSSQAGNVNAGATEGVGRGSGWCLQDWICRSLSQLTWGLR